VSATTERCSGCGATVPRTDGPTHEYIGASPGCWAIFTELAATTPMNQLVVDTYAVQHPGTPSRRSIQSVAVHLVSLLMQLEHGVAPARARDGILAARAIAYRFVWLDPPAWGDALTVVSVHDAAGARAWAESVWRAWAPHHDTVRAWADLAGVTR
jgi:hypothetical protein